MEPEGSLPHSQQPATSPYPEPARSSPYPPHPTSWRSNIILSSHLHLGLPSGLFPSGFPTKTLYTPLLSLIRATCPGHLILLDLITRAILGEQYRSLSTSLCSFLLFPVTSSPLGPNILKRPQSAHLPQCQRPRGLTTSLFYILYARWSDRVETCSTSWTHIVFVINISVGLYFL